ARYQKRALGFLKCLRKVSAVPGFPMFQSAGAFWLCKRCQGSLWTDLNFAVPGIDRLRCQVSNKEREETI
ncbi:MAG TPA: hypothetical protein P5522_05775, partial [Spirochaetia bacterium]|nr:hypothetical protein [Spirochaetia bacterium]